MKKKIAQLFFLFLLFFSTGYAQIYVATTGNDLSGNGTAALPYKTIVKGVQSAASGATVLVSPGTYNEVSEIFIGQPLTLKKNGTAEVIVDASGRGTAANKYMVGIVNTGNVTIEGITFANNIGNGSKGAWILSNNTTGTRNNNVIKNCSFENIGWISNNLSTKPSSSSIAANAIRVEGGSATAITNVTLLNNNVENCATGWGEAVTITGNVNGFTVQGNFIFNIANIGIVAAGNYFTGAPTNVNQARNGLIIGNEVYNCMSGIATSAGIYLDGSINCRVEKNEVYRCGAGISIGGEQSLGTGATVPGGHILNNNEIYNNVIAGIIIGSNNATTATVNTKIFNNTFYKNRTGVVVNGITSIGTAPNEIPLSSAANNFGGEVQLQNINGVTFKNNIVYAFNSKKTFVALAGYTVAAYVSDYNLFFRDVDTSFMFDRGSVSFNGNTGAGASYATLAAFKTATSLDLNSTIANPAFVNAAIFDFYLSAGSSARNKGDIAFSTTNSGTTDFIFNTRRREGRVDIGCLEYQTGTAGRAAIADDVEVTKEETIPSFKIYPNPTTDVVNINFGKKIEKGNIAVIDAAGKVLLNLYFNNSFSKQINLKALHVSNQQIFIKINDAVSTSVHKIMVQ